jgi:CO/xanthine dehydrogenase Mo-binding subunit
MNAQARLIGAAIPRLEDTELVQGAARYVGDLQVPHTLSVVFVRCPSAHALVRNLSLDRARQRHPNQVLKEVSCKSHAN